ncbi:GMC oxidoreductase [Streptomyces solaniscabiei]|uniref:GMC oxidoreductase n=1 Tax=Streptomyces solaniscabiei TaxID=2683255 RepID=UPI001CE2FCC9|nr:GMC oxidoreductase [Streptomyces solaniscabiei]
MPGVRGLGAGPGGAEPVDAIVVGSGFGGAVAAFRLAAAGLDVVVLERGAAHPPGSFPRTPAQFAGALWAPRDGVFGLYDAWRFGGFDAVVASGLGGGSLIYANVLLRKDEHWFVRNRDLPGGGREHWPLDRADLDPHYDEVERMLGATPYPLDDPAYLAAARRTVALREAAAATGHRFALPPLGVSFAPRPGAAPAPGRPLAEAPYGNLHGAARRTCRLCGECNVGCNDGAKNSLDHTYLSAARHHGADLRTLHEVREVRALPGGGYAVDYTRHVLPGDTPGPDAGAGGRGTLHCRRLVLAAGALGTVRLLLRSRDHLPGLSPALGSRFSTNGDVLAFLLRARSGGRPRPLAPSSGPVITGAVRLPDAADPGPGGGGGQGAADGARGGYVQDGGYPAFLQWLVENGRLHRGAGRAARFLADRIAARGSGETRIGASLAGLLGDGLWTETSLPLLGMGRDVPDGRLALRGGRLTADWTPRSSRAYFDGMRAAMRDLAGALEAGFADNPLGGGGRVITVHPVGGAPIGTAPREAVCDPFGAVFGHPGLYVVDGAAMPGPVGANPSLTIAAFADRAACRMLEQPPPVSAVRPAPGHRRATSLTFAQTLHGVCSLSTGSGGERGRARLALAVTVDDAEAFLDDPDPRARAEGRLDWAPLGSGLAVRGEVRVTARDGTAHYRLDITTPAGRGLRLLGRQRLPGALLRPGHLVFDITEPGAGGPDQPGTGDGPEGPGGQGGSHGPGRTIARGTVGLRPGAALLLPLTVRTTGPRGPEAAARVGTSLLGALWSRGVR